MPRVLIIAYGNPLRSDDGVAWHAVEALQQKFSPAEIEIACLHQLSPELAETLSRFRFVIFVDAASSPEGHPGEIRVEDLGGKDPADSGSPFFHALSPNAVIRLAETLYGAKPRAFALTVAGQNFDHGESLSPAVAAALPHLVARIEALARDWNDAR
ncbi:MAG: hydrogenase maturation protease [Candidatus Sulfotelmatobacter sp.]